jgi:ribonuclease D
MWRHLEAEKENRPLTQVMKTGVLNTIVQKIDAGESALLKDRTLPVRFIRENLDTFRRLYEDKISNHEKELLDQAPETSNTTSRAGMLIDMLHQLIKYKGLKRGVSPKLVITGKELQLMRTDRQYMPTALKEGWRKKLLGKELLRLLENREDFYITIKKNKFTLRMKSRGVIFWQNLVAKIKGRQEDREEEDNVETAEE